MCHSNSRLFGNGLARKRFWIAAVLFSLAALCGATASAQPLTWNGGGGNPSDGGGTWDLGTNWWNTNTLSATNWTNGSDASFGAGPSSGTAGTVTINNDVVSPNSITFNTTGNGKAYTITGGSIDTGWNSSGSLPVNLNVNANIASPLTGLGGLTVNGSGTLTLTGQDTYGGPTTIGSGATVQLGNGATAGSIVNSAITDNGTLAFASPNAVSYSSAITGSGGLTQIGPGGLTLNGTAGNTYGGLTTVATGALTLSVSGAIAIPGNLQVNAGATLNNAASSSFQIAGTSNVAVAGTWNLGDNSESINGLSVSNGGAVVFTSNSVGNTLTIGSTGLTTSGSGWLEIGTVDGSGAATVTVNGPITLSGQGGAGSIYLRFGSGAGRVLNANGNITMTGGGIAYGWATPAGTVNLGPNVAVTTNASPATSYIGNNNIGLLTLNGTNTFTVAAEGAGTDDLLIAAKITGAGNLVKAGPGQMDMSNTLWSGGQNNFNGSITVSGGTLLMADANAGTTSGITIDASNAYDSVFLYGGTNNDSQGGNITVQGSGPGNAVLGGYGTNNGSLTGNISLNNAVELDGAAAGGNLNLSGAVSGSNSITKIGPGKVTLSGAISGFTGQMIVDAGILTVDQAGTGTAPILLGDTSGTADAGLYSGVAGGGGSVTISQNIIIQAGSSGRALIGHDASSCCNGTTTTTFNGAVTMGKTVYFDSQTGNAAGPLIFGGTLTETPGSSFAVHSIGGSTLVLATTTALGYSGGTYVDAGTTQFQFFEPGAATAANAQLSYANSAHTGTNNGAVIIDGGNFEFATRAASGTANQVVTFDAPITVTSAGGGLYSDQYGGGAVTNNQFTGPISLGGMLGLGVMSAQYNGSGYGNGNANYQGLATQYAGTITINNAAAALVGLRPETVSGVDPVLNGNIVDGAGPAENLLIIQPINGLTISGPANTYAGGTVIDSAGGMITVSAASALGTGSVQVASGGRLRLSAAANIAAGSTLHISSNQAILSILSLGSDFDPGSSSTTGVKLTADSAGVLALDAATFNTALNLANLGNGMMSLGSFSGGTYAAASLGANSDGNYHLGGGGGILTLSSANVLTGNSGLVVGSTAYNGTGTVKLTNANNFSGPITINNGSTLEGAAQASGTPFGSTTATVNLNSGATLQLDGISSVTNTSIGQLNIDGNGTVKVNQTGSATTSLTIASLPTRSASTPYGLAIQGSAATSNLGDKEQVIIASGAPTVTNGMVSPYFYGSNGGNSADFLTYSSSTGFQVAGYTQVAANGLAGAGNIHQNNIVNLGGAQTLGASDNITVYALNANSQSIYTSTATINVISGGVFFSIGQYNTVTVQPTLAFGSAEGVLVNGSVGNGANINVSGLSGSGGLTKLGVGYIGLTTNNSATLTGQISILQGTLGLSADNQLGSASNSIYGDGGTLYINSGFATARNIVVGEGGLSIGENQYSGNSTFSGAITGPGMLSLSNGAGVNFAISGAAAGNTYSGGTTISGGASNVSVAAASSLGSGDVAVRAGVLTLLGNGNIAASAALSTVYGSTVNFQGNGATIGSLDGGGTVNLNTSSANTLTVGGNNASTVFDGTLNQTGNGAWGLTKVGGGTFTVANVQSYSGPTTVNAGTLKAAVAGAIPAVSAVSVTGGALDVTAAPQTVGSLSIGSLGSLDLALGNVLTSSGTAAFNSGSTLNLSGSVGTLPELLMNYLGSAAGTFSSLSLDGSPLASTDLTYLSGSLELTSTAVPISGPIVWQGSLSNSWTDTTSWNTGTIPNGAGAKALVGSPTAAPTAITLDGPQTVGQLTLSATSATAGYTLAAGNGGSLTMNNSGVGPAQILITVGSHSISAPVSLAGALSIVPTAGTTLDISGNISQQTLGAGRLSLAGPGTLVLGGNNSYTGGTSVTAAGATLVITSGSSIAANTSLTIDAGGTFVFDPNGTADLVATASARPAGAIAAVPEPGNLALLVAALVVGFGVWRKRI